MPKLTKAQQALLAMLDATGSGSLTIVGRERRTAISLALNGDITLDGWDHATITPAGRAALAQASEGGVS